MLNISTVEFNSLRPYFVLQFTPQLQNVTNSTTDYIN